MVANREGKALRCAPKGKFSFFNGVDDDDDDDVDDNDNDYKGNGNDDVVTAPPRVSQLAAV